MRPRCVPTLARHAQGVMPDPLGSIFYEDTVSTSGRLLITSLDPMYHHGSHFMPATTRFLDGFLPYLKGTTAELAKTT